MVSLLLADGGSQRIEAHGAAAELLDDGPQHLVVDAVQAEVVDLQPVQGLEGHIPGGHVVGHD